MVDVEVINNGNGLGDALSSQRRSAALRVEPAAQSQAEPAATIAVHTPGPWRVEDDTTLIWGDCDPEDRSTYGMGYPVAEARVLLGASLFGRERRWEEAVANAHLIAAAPDLLDALEAAEEWLSGWASAEPYLSQIRSALAKARGQS